MITFSDEVKCIWQRKFTGATILFCINRYVLLLERTLQAVIQFRAWQTQTAENVDMVGLLLGFPITRHLQSSRCQW